MAFSKFGLKEESGRVAAMKKLLKFFIWTSLVPLVLIFGISYFSAQSILKEKAGESLLTLNNSKAEQLNLFLEKLKVRTADWSSDGKIRGTTEEIGAQGCKGAPLQDCSLAADLSIYLRDKKLPLDPTFVLVDVLDINGIVVASSDINRLGHDESRERISFEQAKSAAFGQAVLVPELVQEPDELEGKPMLHIAAPLVSFTTGKIVGVFLAHTLNDELNAVIAVEEGKTLETYLVNAEKLMITPSRFMSDAVLKQGVNTPPARACFEDGKDFQGEYLNYRGEKVLGVSKCQSQSLGAIITEIDVSETLRSVNQFRNISLISLAALLFFAIGYSLFAGRGLVPQATTNTTITTTTIITTIIIIIGVSFSLFFSKTLSSFAWRMKTEPVFDLVQGQAERHIKNVEHFTRWQSEEARWHFADFVSELKLSLPPMAGVKIYNSEAILVYSDIIKEKIGQKEEEEDVLEALRGEQKIETAEPEIQKEFGLRNLLEIYTPIYLGGRQPVGVAEVYFNIADLVVFIRRLQFFVWILIAVSLSAIFSLLRFAFGRQNAQITRQAKELATIIERSPHGIYTINKDGIIEFFNPKMVEIEGLKSAQEAIGLNALELSKYKDVGLDKFFREGLAGKSFTTEICHISSVTQKERYCHYFGVPIFGPDGKTAERLLLMVEDITERKRLEAELAEYTKKLELKVAERTRELEISLAETRKLASIVESSFEGVIIVDQKGLIKYVNPAWQKLTGWNAEEVIDKVTPSILKSGKQDASFYKKMWDVISGGQVFYAEIVNKRKDGSLYDAEVVIFPIKFGDEVVYVEISRDISERKKLDEAKTSFISIASHQLRTPLSSMRWISEMFLSGDMGPLTDEQKSFMRDIYKSNQRLIDLVNILLISTRLEAGRISITPVPADLVLLTKEVLDTVKSLIDAKKLQITIKVVSKTIPKINLEPEVFRQVMLNLLSNAINYTSERGKIDISSELKEDRVVFSIKDNGIGIPQKEQPRIFQKFYRASNAVSFVPEGNGLGLSLVKSLVLGWEGDVWFESEEGKGSTFFFTVPLAGVESKAGAFTLSP